MKLLKRICLCLNNDIKPLKSNGGFGVAIYYTIDWIRHAYKAHTTHTYTHTVPCSNFEELKCQTEWTFFYSSFVFSVSTSRLAFIDNKTIQQAELVASIRKTSIEFENRHRNHQNKCDVVCHASVHLKLQHILKFAKYKCRQQRHRHQHPINKTPIRM